MVSACRSSASSSLAFATRSRGTCTRTHFLRKPSTSVTSVVIWPRMKKGMPASSSNPFTRASWKLSFVSSTTTRSRAGSPVFWGGVPANRETRQSAHSLKPSRYSHLHCGQYTIHLAPAYRRPQQRCGIRLRLVHPSEARASLIRVLCAECGSHPGAAAPVRKPCVKLGGIHGGETTRHLHADPRPYRCQRADQRGRTPSLRLLADRYWRRRPLPQRFYRRVPPVQRRRTPPHRAHHLRQNPRARPYPGRRR